MDQVTQQNAAMVEETSAATHKLSAEAGSLSELIGRFKVSGTSRVTHAAPSADARSLQARVARFSGSNALKMDEWQEF